MSNVLQVTDSTFDEEIINADIPAMSGMVLIVFQARRFPDIMKKGSGHRQLHGKLPAITINAFNHQSRNICHNHRVVSDVLQHLLLLDQFKTLCNAWDHARISRLILCTSSTASLA